MENIGLTKAQPSKRVTNIFNFHIESASGLYLIHIESDGEVLNGKVIF